MEGPVFEVQLLLVEYWELTENITPIYQRMGKKEGLRFISFYPTDVHIIVIIVHSIISKRNIIVTMSAGFLLSLIVMMMFCRGTSTAFQPQPKKINVCLLRIVQMTVPQSRQNKTTVHFAKLSSKYITKRFTSNALMIFTRGRHCLGQPPGREKAINVTRVSMQLFNNTRQRFPEHWSIWKGYPLRNSIISCNCDSRWERSGIYTVYKSNSIYIKNQTMEECGVNFTLT